MDRHVYKKKQQPFKFEKPSASLHGPLTFGNVNLQELVIVETPSGYFKPNGTYTHIGEHGEQFTIQRLESHVLFKRKY